MAGWQMAAVINSCCAQFILGKAKHISLLLSFDHTGTPQFVEPFFRSRASLVKPMAPDGLATEGAKTYTAVVGLSSLCLYECEC